MESTYLEMCTLRQDEKSVSLMELVRAYVREDDVRRANDSVGFLPQDSSLHNDPYLIDKIQNKAEFAKDRADFFKVITVVFGIMLVISNILWATTEQYLPIGLFPLPFFATTYIAYLLKKRSHRQYKELAEKERRSIEKANLEVQQPRRPIPSFGIRLEGQRSYETYEEASIRIDKEHRRANIMVITGLVLVGVTVIASMIIRIFKEVM